MALDLCLALLSLPPDHRSPQLDVSLSFSKYLARVDVAKSEPLIYSYSGCLQAHSQSVAFIADLIEC